MSPNAHIRFRMLSNYIQIRALNLQPNCIHWHGITFQNEYGIVPTRKLCNTTKNIYKLNFTVSRTLILLHHLYLYPRYEMLLACLTHWGLVTHVPFTDTFERNSNLFIKGNAFQFVGCKISATPLDHSVLSFCIRAIQIRFWRGLTLSPNCTKTNRKWLK